MRSHPRLPALALLLAACLPAHAGLFTFDGAPSGTPANHLAGPVQFSPGIFSPDTDEFGSDIPGTEKWRKDAGAPAITVDNPILFGRGSAPSGANALNALFQPVLVLFPPSTGTIRFGATLDNDPFGDSALAVGFYDADDHLLASVPIDQTVPGFVFESEALSGVAKVVLPAGAFYDNLSYAAVPEVDGRTLAAGLLTLAGWLHRRFRR